MPLLLDTYNVLHHPGALPPELAGIDVAGLVGLLQCSRYRRRQTTLVCDGVRARGAPRGKHGLVQIRYAGSRRTADDVIVEMIDRSTAPRRLLVVSSDRAVIRAAKRARCDTLTSPALLRRLAEDFELARTRRGGVQRPGGPLSSEEVDAWTHLFGSNGSPSEDDVELPAHLQKKSKEDRPASKSKKTGKTKKVTPDAEKKKASGKPSTGPVVPPGILAEAERIWRDGRSG